MSFEIREGNCLELLRAMPDNSVHCAVTSPPYWGLRNYGTEPQIWGGLPDCPHVWGEKIVDKSMMTPGSAGSGLTNPESVKLKRFIKESSFCLECGAWYGHLGLEPTIELYLEHMVSIFRELRRVLRKEGVFWLNIGDSYYNWRPGAGNGSRRGKTALAGTEESNLEYSPNRSEKQRGLKEKDLCMIPARLALALQADGWYIRSEIIWDKPNPMPESTGDRCTRSHEQIYMLTKRPTYFYDAEAIKELVTGNSNPRGTGSNPKAIPRVSGWAQGEGVPHTPEHYNNSRVKQNGSFASSVVGLVTHRNMRTMWEIEPVCLVEDDYVNVWKMPTVPYKEAHFATFPPELPRRCILAGSSPYTCPVCSAPWERIVEKRSVNRTELPKNHPEYRPKDYEGKATDPQAPGSGRRYTATRFLGWLPTCGCYVPAPEKPVDDPKQHYAVSRSVVLDPFNGAGTTGIVAEELGRSYIGLELSNEYVEMSLRRRESKNPLLAAITEAEKEAGASGQHGLFE